MSNQLEYRSKEPATPVHTKVEKVARTDWQTSDTSLTASMNGSLTSFNFSNASLNLDNLTLAELEHLSNRSLPATNIAQDADAPWNTNTRDEDKQSVPHVPCVGSALNELQRSISAITADFGASIYAAPSFTIEEDSDEEYNDESITILQESAVSLCIEDLEELDDDAVGMDETAHRGNVSSLGRGPRTRNTNHIPYDPLFIRPESSSSSLSYSEPAKAWLNDSLLLDRYNSSGSVDGDDVHENDYTVDLIQMLRNQVASLEKKLATERLLTVQLKNNTFKERLQNQPIRNVAEDDVRAFARFVGNKNSNMVLMEPATKAIHELVNESVELIKANAGVKESIAHLKVSIYRRQGKIMLQRNKEECPEDSSDDSNSSEKSEHNFPSDEFWMQVLANQMNTMQEQVDAQRTRFLRDNAYLQQQLDDNAARISTLELR